MMSSDHQQGRTFVKRGLENTGPLTMTLALKLCISHTKSYVRALYGITQGRLTELFHNFRKVKQAEEGVFSLLGN